MITPTRQNPKEILLMRRDIVMAPHLGISLRSIFGCAIANKDKFTGKRFKVQYKGAIIAEMTLGKDF